MSLFYFVFLRDVSFCQITDIVVDICNKTPWKGCQPARKNVAADICSTISDAVFPYMFPVCKSGWFLPDYSLDYSWSLLVTYSYSRVFSDPWIYLCPPIFVYEKSIPASADIRGCPLFISRYGRTQKIMQSFVYYRFGAGGIICAAGFFCAAEPLVPPVLYPAECFVWPKLIYDRMTGSVVVQGQKTSSTWSSPLLALCVFYDSSGNCPPPQKAAGDPFTILFLWEVTFPFENCIPSGCARMWFHEIRQMLP